MSIDHELLGGGAPPLVNGELLFDEPWQSRVFGIARLLSEQGLYDWDDFRDSLIKRIQAWENANPGAGYHYYPLFLDALTDTLESRGILGSEELLATQLAFANRPAGHDH